MKHIYKATSQDSQQHFYFESESLICAKLAINPEKYRKRRNVIEASSKGESYPFIIDGWVIQKVPIFTP